jgi:serine/threonine-protein kinase
VGRAALVAAGAVLIAAGGAALGYALTRKGGGGAMTPQASGMMDTAIAQLDAQIAQARGEIRGTATALSGLDVVQSVVAADARTALDLAEKGELKFSPKAGEMIELGRVIEGKPESLLVQPAGGSSMGHDGVAGSYIDIVGNQLAISEVVTFAPKSDGVTDEGKKITGYIAASRMLDLGPLVAKLEEANINGRLENRAKSGVQSRGIGKPDANATKSTRELPSQKSFQIVVDVKAAKAATPKGLVGAGAGVAVLGLIVIVAGALRRRSDAPPQTQQHSIQSMETVPSGPQQIANAPTKLSAQVGVPIGTPSPVDGAAATHFNPANIGPGAMIGRWEVLRRLGSGGMADVYLAHSKGEAGFEKLVAIKVMHPHLARNPRAVEHFLDEARLAARITHPNVVAIQDLGKIGNDYVIVMDYVEGVDLERMLASARAGGRYVPLEVALGILCRICDGLNGAHNATATDGTPLNLIHRDVKSANVLVARQGQVKVVDFGIAKAATQAHNTIAGETKGTPSTMAPEQRVGEVVDVRADVYSVAVIGYEILTGHAVNLDLATLAHLGIERWPHLPAPSTQRMGLPQELDAILLTAMSFEREHRPANCAAFEEMFERVMKQRGLSCSDKDIARWVESELALLVPAFVGASSPAPKGATPT